MKTAQQLIDEARLNISEISTEQLHHILQQQPQALLIDVRETSEYQQQHISQAINYPRGTLEMQLHQHPVVANQQYSPQQALNKLAQQPIYLICRSGGRSALAAESLQRMGFTTVYSVKGGMQAWLNTGSIVQ